MRGILIVLLLVFGACASPKTGALAADYEFEPYPGSQWYAPDGEAVPKESGVINAITGPGHCGWESGVILHLGWPLGHEAVDSSESRQYFRDPKKVFPQESLATGFDAEVDLPRGAEDTGYRTDFMELWIDPREDSAAYLVFSDHVERWSRGSDDIACG